ncbi:UNVERIFIED_CONTAM: hypothetical protein Sradi_4876200 [Sesamum radiatum]|uniref:Uncharacterized protein n=1 Tax=Sesamum radiatum TaxID=300843 RepID=A0AAW2N0U3_SESRA
MPSRSFAAPPPVATSLAPPSVSVRVSDSSFNAPTAAPPPSLAGSPIELVPSSFL